MQLRGEKEPFTENQCFSNEASSSSPQWDCMTCTPGAFPPGLLICFFYFMNQAGTGCGAFSPAVRKWRENKEMEREKMARE